MPVGSPFDSSSRTRTSKRADAAAAIATTKPRPTVKNSGSRVGKQINKMLQNPGTKKGERAGKKADRIESSEKASKARQKYKNPTSKTRMADKAKLQGSRSTLEKRTPKGESNRSFNPKTGETTIVNKRFKKSSVGNTYNTETGDKLYGPIDAGMVKKKTTYGGGRRGDEKKVETKKKRGILGLRTPQGGTKKKTVTTNPDAGYGSGEKTVTKTRFNKRRGDISSTKTKGMTEREQRKAKYGSGRKRS